MPPAAVHGLRTGSFTLSRILFRTNVISGNTPEIPLGATFGTCRWSMSGARDEHSTEDYTEGTLLAS